MEMTETFDRLKKMQEILAEKYSIESRKQEAPKQLSSQSELVARLKKEFVEKNKTYDEIQRKISSLNAQLDDAITSRADYEKSMENIKTHREYEILDKEIKDITTKEQILRDSLQSERKRFSDLDDEISQTDAFIKEQENQLNESKLSIEKEVSEMDKSLKSLSKEEEKLSDGLDEALKFKFERIIKSKQGKGIVALKSGVCDGCHMILPAQFTNRVHDGDEIVFCPYCSRILFYEESENNEGEYFHLDDAGSLVDDDNEDLLDDEEDEESEFEE